MEFHPKSAPTERSGHPAEIQNGYPPECNEHSRRGHQVGQRCVLRRGRGRGFWPLGGLFGSPGRVFSGCHESKRHKVYPLRIRHRNIWIPCPAFQALDRPQNVHLPSKGNRCLPGDVWYKHLPVPRRLARHRRDPPVSSQLQGHSQYDNLESGFPHQRGKAWLDAHPVPNVPGLSSRSCPDDGLSVWGPNRSSETPNPMDHKGPSKPGKTMEVSLRPLGQHDPAGPEGSTPHPFAPVFHTGALVYLNGRLTPGDSQLRGRGGVPLVAPYTQPHVQGSFLGPVPGVDGGHRCFILRVGRSPQRPDGFWHLANPMAVQAHKLAGTAGSLAHAETLKLLNNEHSHIISRMFLYLWLPLIKCVIESWWKNIEHLLAPANSS